MADIIVVMRDGLVEQTGSPIEIFENPANQFVASFIGTPQMNFMDVTVDKDDSVHVPDLGVHLALPQGRFDLTAHHGKQVTLGARPEHLVPTGNGVAFEPDTQFEAEIEFGEMLGNETLLFCRKNAIKFVARMQNPRMIEPGEKITFGIDIGRLNLFDQNTGETLRQT